MGAKSGVEARIEWQRAKEARVQKANLGTRRGEERLRVLERKNPTLRKRREGWATLKFMRIVA